jgi:hypothetical protein
MSVFSRGHPAFQRGHSTLLTGTLVGRGVSSRDTPWGRDHQHGGGSNARGWIRQRPAGHPRSRLPSGRVVRSEIEEWVGTLSLRGTRTGGRAAALLRRDPRGPRPHARRAASTLGMLCLALRAFDVRFE